MTDQVAIKAPIPTPPNFPVEWPDPADARLFWSQDRMHWPDPVGWLAESFEFGAMSEGAEQAASEFGLPIRIRIRIANRYPYMSIGPRSEDPEVMAELGRGAEAALGPRIMGLQRTWEDEALPELKADVATLRAFDYASASDADLAAHLDWVAQRRIRQLALHFLLVLPQHAALGLFGQVYRELLRPDDETEPYLLLQGFLNKTVEGGHALWRLSREAAKSPAVREAIALGEPAAVFARLDRSPEGRAFAARLRAYLDEFGWRGDSINIDDRTWATYPRTPLSTLQTYLTQPDEDSPEASHAALVEGRAAALARARGRLADAPDEARARFEAVLEVAQFATVLHEDHNYYIDQMLQHLSRRAFVAAGSRLAARGQLADAEDVIYLTADETRGSLVDPARRDLRALVEGRRQELEHWRAVTPPPAFGTPPPETRAGELSPLEEGLARFVGVPPEAARHSREVRGHAGSRGEVTGLARVALTLEAAGALQSGEILVCPTTAPAWTPLFATAKAVVTDTGGILSHCAVVAREFGIPAVVGTQVGTTTIRTGQRITVDGGTGVVTLEEDAR